jgi:hypothetical protein
VEPQRVVPTFDVAEERHAGLGLEGEASTAEELAPVLVQKLRIGVTAEVVRVAGTGTSTKHI